MASANATAEFPPGFAEESRAHWVLIPVIVFTSVCPPLVAIRTWARHTTSGLGFEDFVILGAQAFALATDIMFITMVQHGFGHHLAILAPPDREHALRTFWLAQMTYKVSLQLTKIALLMFYMRIFRHITWFKKVSIATIAFLIIYLVTTCVTSIMQCTPVAKAWDADLDGTCIQVAKFFIFNGTVALATDIIVLMLPLPLIWGLQLPLGQKLALIPVFGLGIFVVVVSTLRLYALIARPQTDTTYDLSSTLWTIIELNLAIMCASLPSVRVLLVRLFPSVFKNSSRYRGSEPRSGGRVSGAAVIGGSGSWGSRSGGSSNNGGWSRVDSAVDNHVSLSAITSSKVRRDETSSEEIMLERKGGIQKTVQYDVEFGIANGVPQVAKREYQY